MSRDFACERGAGLTHRGLRARFPGARGRFLGFDPGASLAAASRLETLLPELCGRRWDVVLLDWPRGFAPHLPFLVRASPACIGFTAPASALGAERVILVESLDPRRLALARLVETGACDFVAVRLGCGEEHDLRARWLARQEGPAACPPEWELAGDEFLYLQARFSALQMEGVLAPSDGKEASVEADARAARPLSAEEQRDAHSLLEAARAGLNFLVIATFPRLERLGQALSVLLEGEEQTNPVSRPSNGSLAAFPAALPFPTAPRMWSPVRLTPESCAQHACVPGFLSRAFLEASLRERGDWKILYRNGLARAVERAGARYQELTKLAIASHEKRDFLRFAHRLALDAGETLPGCFDLLCAAQATVDPNFAYELAAECRDFPGAENAALNGLVERDFPLASFLPRVSHLSISPYSTLQGLKRRKRALRSVAKLAQREGGRHEAVPESKYVDDSWAMRDPPYACSFPDEDLFMEDFVFHCRSQVKEKMRASETAVGELTWSLRDGVDVRETMRNWHLDKIMVKEERATGRADVGSVVFRFEDEEDPSRFAWKSWWLAEAHDKSNLMFYATPYAERIVGPGIARSEFGAFAVVPIPSDPSNPWEDPVLMGLAEHPSEALLLGAAMATEHRALLYFAPRPPSQRIARLLRRSGKTIIFAKLDELPPEKLRRLKTFHILAEAGIRAYADRYIRKE